MWWEWRNFTPRWMGNRQVGTAKKGLCEYSGMFKQIISARQRSAEYTIGICFETAKNTKAFKCFSSGFQRSLWKFSTTGNLYSLKTWLWLAVVACVVHWPISNVLLNDIWLACFTRMCNWNNWHKLRGFMVSSILGHFDLSQLAPFHWSIRSLVNSHLYCTKVNSILRRMNFVNSKKFPLSKKFDVAHGVDRAWCRISERTVCFK